MTNQLRTVTVELSVFAGDMAEEDVKANAERILAEITDGTDFVSFSVVKVSKDN